MRDKKRLREYGRNYMREIRHSTNFRGSYATMYEVISPKGTRHEYFDSYKELAQFFGLSESTLRGYVSTGKSVRGWVINKIYDYDNEEEYGIR